MQCYIDLIFIQKVDKFHISELLIVLGVTITLVQANLYMSWFTPFIICKDITEDDNVKLMSN